MLGNGSPRAALQGPVLAGLAVLTGLTVLAGCGGAEPAEGLTRAETSAVTVDYPSGWVKGDPAQAGSSVTFVARQGAADAPDAQLAVLEKPVKASTASLAAAAMGTARATGQAGRETKRTQAEVEGADEALRVDYTYTLRDAGARGVGVDLVAVKDRDVFVVRITGVQGRLDPGTIDAIVASMRLTGE
ncbi:MAG: hypothetical protein GEV11_20200 [Streptosporangiales bacterium]|nr:hypothetical protein [Streptosporangiales bacterium]